MTMSGWNAKVLMIPSVTALCIPLITVLAYMAANAWTQRLMITGDFVYHVLGQETDAHYILSTRYFEDRMRNQDFVEANKGQLPPEKAPHWKRLPAPGKAHLIHTRNLFLWGEFASLYGITWVLARDSLLGFLRYGDFEPGKHNV